jgi:hypothetical protein
MVISISLLKLSGFCDPPELNFNNIFTQSPQTALLILLPELLRESTSILYPLTDDTL